jgi:hypothetical protein
MCAFHLASPHDNTEDMFGGWIKSFPITQRKLVLCGASAVCWTLWKTRNDACLNRVVLSHPVNVIYRLVVCLLVGQFCRQTKTEEKLRMEQRS